MKTISTKCNASLNRVLHVHGLLNTGIFTVGILGLVLSGITHAEETYVQPDRYAVTVVEGGNLTVVCNVTSSPELDVFWTRNDSASTFTHNGVSLEIPDILREWAGDYVCHSYNSSSTGDNVTVEVVTVDVHYPAKLTMSRSSQKILEGGLLRIQCSWDANPPADVLLINNRTGDVYINGRQQKAAGTFNRGCPTVGCRSWGLYVCTGHNYLNDGNSTDTDNATVLCAPRWDPSSKPDIDYRLKVRLGSNGHFFYMVYLAFPSPNVTWEHHGEILPRSMFYDIPAQRATLLNISNVNVPDYGNYTLTLTNEFGEFSANYELIPLGPPARPTDLQYHNVTYDGATLTWTAGYDMGSQQNFVVYDIHTYEMLTPRIYDNSTTHGIGATFSYTLRHLSSEKSYSLSILARNAHDSYSDLAAPVHFKTKKGPDPPTTHRPSTGHTGVIVGAIVGGLCVVGVVIFSLYFSVRCRRAKQVQLPKSDDILETTAALANHT